MQPEDVLRHPALRLSEAQRRRYFDDGYVALESAISAPWVQRLQQALVQVLDDSRACTETDDKFILEEGHGAQNPRLHRLVSPEDHYPLFWDFIAGDEMTALAADVVGPDVKFHHAKLNVKSGRGSRGFDWHQDISSWPHTDYSPVTVGVYIDGCSLDMGPLTMVRGSHHGPLHSMYDATGRFANRVPDAHMQTIAAGQMDSPTGPAGTVVLLNCRTIHGSLTNRSERDRPMLLAVYSSADSFPYTAAPIHGSHLGEIVRGRPARFASFDARPCELPPDWGRTRFVGPWKLQQDSTSPYV